jgi:Ran GTPase-activating protein (RanGAP) involved in mRNA processing and transport
MRTMLAPLRQLQLLSLADAGLKAETVLALAELAGHGSLMNLTYIQLGHNELGEGGAVALARLFQTAVHLRELHLDVMDLSDAGMAQFAKPLAALRELRHLNLAANSFSEKGAQTLCDAFGAERLVFPVHRQPQVSMISPGQGPVDVFLTIMTSPHELAT